MRYCNVLNSLTGQTQGSECQWPQNLGPNSELPSDFTSTNVELSTRVAKQLSTTLANGNQLHELLKDPNSELAVAHEAFESIFKNQLSLWKSYAAASNEDRVITDVEVDFFTEKAREAQAEAVKSLREGGVSPEVVTFAQAIKDRETLDKYGLLFDEGMVETVTRLCVNSASGRSTLLIGDKGVAKTQVAKFVSGLFSRDGQPKFISGDGSMMKDEFIGKMTLTEKNGATVTTFQPGILTECMELGIPLVLDEINLIDPAIAMRLQDILLRRPGDIVRIHEDGNEPITIKNGFCVIATANEASVRYQSRAALDPAFRDRFDVLPIGYPDGSTPLLQTSNRPQSLTRLAYAFTVSSAGIKNNRVTSTDALWLTSVAHASQQLYSKPSKDVNSGPLSINVSNIVDEDEPRMTDCITPRKMVDILRSISDGLNPYDLAYGVKGLTIKTIAAMQQSSDREIMYDVIRLMHSGDIKDFNEAEIKEQLRI